MGQKLQQMAFFALLDSFRIQHPIPEYKFHLTRKWRIDYAWPEKRVALEIEGGVFVSGRHSRGVGMVNDMEKYNTLASQGWLLLRVTPSTLLKIETIKLIIKTININ